MVFIYYTVNYKVIMLSGIRIGVDRAVLLILTGKGLFGCPFKIEFISVDINVFKTHYLIILLYDLNYKAIFTGHHKLIFR